MTSRQLIHKFRQTSAASARLVVVACGVAIALGCSGEDSGDDRVILEMAFGPMIGIEAIAVVPDCEALEDEGEFRSSIQATVHDQFLGFPISALLYQLAETLSSNQRVDRDIDETIQLRDGDEVCVSSVGTEEVDPILDEPMQEDEVCATVDASTTSVDYDLVMTLFACELRVYLTGTVSEVL